MTNLVNMALEGMFKWRLDHLEVTINDVYYLFHHQVTICLAGHSTLPMESHIIRQESPRIQISGTARNSQIIPLAAATVDVHNKTSKCK
jgi:hypothetical protein